MSFTVNDDFNEKLADIIGKDRVKEIEQRDYLAAQIVSHRRKKQMTQQELAKAINVAKPTIIRLESGLTQPNYQTLLSLSRALDTPLIIDAKYEEHQNAKT
ncbi:DNA-binding transcriptional regulator, XRE-family HTH domain [Lentibacillus persicus]|uniref:DNA-binding transcriptional regulator, XRE-family HTH domain n=1 Tax=Lentibacillus persicus TaxID=640948 RepID=A0A1I1SC77_9BACI|nr:DNA-binding transcriptional regulator, XRE-family HTH domain [Lentibacillus persicus]